MLASSLVPGKIYFFALCFLFFLEGMSSATCGLDLNLSNEGVSKGHSIITFSQNDQNLDPLPPCLHLFDFGNPLPPPFLPPPPLPNS